MKRKIRRALLASSFLAIVPQAQAAQLLANPSFELPVITSNNCGGGPPASCEGFFIGDDIGGWTVVGHSVAAGLFPMSLITNAFPSGSGTHFTSQNGNQNLDLSGSGDQGAEGVVQTVATVPGQSYLLSFYVGNEDNLVPNFGLNSSVQLLIDGTTQGAFTSSGRVVNDASWANFTVNFVAPTNSTSIEFLNATLTGDNYTGLDNVTLTGPAVVPVDLSEPGTLGVMAFGVGLMLFLRRKKPVRRLAIDYYNAA